MSDLRQHFLDESIDNLTVLQKELAEQFDAARRREAFRTVHTIKGGAQLFGLSTTAGVAARLENILSASEPAGDPRLLLEGLGFLVDSLRESEAAPPAELVEKLRRAARETARSNILMTRLPPPVFKNFSPAEREATLSALRAGQKIYCAEVGFDVSDFAGEYRRLRKILTEKSEILATLPSEKHTSAGRIGFRIFLATRETVESLQASVAGLTIEISSHSCTEKPPDDLFKMLSQIAAHAAELAEKAGKTIRLTVLSSDIKLSPAVTKAFFDILLHLVRNAVDHAIEKSGSIEVRLYDDDDQHLYLAVLDDGKGIDAERVRARAVARKLLAADARPAEAELLELIFAPEFSTADRVTETSGRGVGLDAVKAAVEKLNGKISVRNRKTRGAIFEIFVPQKL